MKHILLIATFALALVLPAFSRKADVSMKKAKSAITGSYSMRGGGDLDVQQLSDGSIKFYLLASTGQNTGTICATVPLKNSVAVYSAQLDAQSSRCEITLKFSGKKVIVSQKGIDSDCGFGVGVSADGTYTKRSSKIPTFAECD